MLLYMQIGIRLLESNRKTSQLMVSPINSDATTLDKSDQLLVIFNYD